MTNTTDVERIKSAINRLIALFKENPERWKVERENHWAFLNVLFDEFSPKEIRTKFRWEVPVGKPPYGHSNKSAAVDLVWMVDSSRWIGIEIESNLSPGAHLESELITCVRKFQTDSEIMKNLVVGYIVPLICRNPNIQARGHRMTYGQLIAENVAKAEKCIRPGDKIEILKEGIIPSDSSI